MKTLENQTLLYDDDCPLCRVYTSGFVKTGMLDKQGKKPFGNLTQDERQFVDMRRAANEIALVDNENRTVLYGIDSLLKVIGYSFPWIAAVGNLTPVKFALKKLYSFISYNRKVIIPAAQKDGLVPACVPDFNLKYRVLYIAFAGLLTALVLWKYRALMPIPQGSFYGELFLAFGQLAVQGAFLLKFSMERILNYFGNLITVSLLGALILLMLLLAARLFEIPKTAFEGWFVLTVLIMFAEHYRRVKLLEIPHHLCFTWVLYRLVALAIILNL